MTSFKLPIQFGRSMIALVGFVSILMVLGSSISFSAGDIFPFSIHKAVLENGLTVIVVPYDSPGVVAYYTVVRTGSRNEVEPGHSGFAHFFEHMMFRGTEKYSEQKYNDTLKSIGADTNASTSDDVTTYYINASSSALETIMDLESDRFRNLKYTEAAFRTEAGSIMGEYNKNYSVPFQSIFEKLRDTAFSEHTYRHTTMGFLADIKDMPNQYEYSLKFFDRWYRPENCALIIVGDIKPETTEAMAKKYYGNWKRGSFKLEVPPEQEQTAPRGAHIDWKNRTLPYVVLAYHVPAFSDTNLDGPALDMLSQLMFSETSALYQKLVIEKQEVDQLGGGWAKRRDPYLFTISTRVKNPEDGANVRKEIESALDAAQTQPFTETQMARVRSFLKYSYVMGLNTPSRIASQLALYVQLAGEPQAVNRYYALYDRVTPEKLQEVAKKYFRPENQTVVTLSFGGAK
ncbi:MAG: insulinase family protein [Acidobacteriia bacterium]|nr:insulinase family protein [Terriglobia bacterium]